MGKKIRLIFALFAFAVPCARAQQPAIIHFPELEPKLNSASDTLYIINFWATWCKPCVAELPYFEAAHNERAGQPVKVLLVSVDFKSDYNSRLLPFLKKKKMNAEVVLLDEPNFNNWVDKVSPEWSGAIPATVFVRGSRNLKEFHEGEFTREELNQRIEKYISIQP